MQWIIIRYFFFLSEEVIPQIIMLQSNGNSTFIDDKLSGGIRQLNLPRILVMFAYRRMLGLRHCRNLVNGWLVPSRTDVWGLLTGHSIVKPRLHKSPRCVGLFAGAFLPSNRFSGTASHPNTRRRITPRLFRPMGKSIIIPLCRIEFLHDIYDLSWQV